MLILTREQFESVVMKCDCGRCSKITVVSIRKDKARLGIEAPKEVTIHREEVQREIDKEAEA